MNPKNGEILAKTSKPSLDLNNSSNSSSNSKDVQKLWKNASVQRMKLSYDFKFIVKRRGVKWILKQLSF